MSEVNDVEALTAFPAETETTTIDGLSIRYARAPRESAETLLLLSPWPESIFAFLPSWRAFTANHDVIAVDLPGFGRSEGRSDVLAPEAMGNFIARIVAHFGLVKPHAIGPDVGTSSLLFAAANHPDLFATVTVGSGGVAYPLDITSTLKEVVAMSEKEVGQLDAKEFVESTLGSLENYKAPAFVHDDYVTSYSGPGRLAQSAQLVRHYPDDLPRLKERLGEIRTPVLVITGRDDPFVPVSNGQYLVDRLPTAKLEVVNTGHLVWEDEAGRYADLVLSWVKAHSVTRA